MIHYVLKHLFYIRETLLGLNGISLYNTGSVLPGKNIQNCPGWRFCCWKDLRFT